MISRNSQLWAGIWAALIAGAAYLITLTRRDARRDAVQELEKKDQKNAKAISDRVNAGRADPDWVRKFSNRGYRD